MRLQKRNTVPFLYRECVGEEEIIVDGLHTGNTHAIYGEPVAYRGNISAPSGSTVNQLFGITTPYSHVLVMDKPKANIKEDGIIEYGSAKYEIKAVRPSLNVLTIALRKQTEGDEEPVESGDSNGD